MSSTPSSRTHVPSHLPPISSINFIPTIRDRNPVTTPNLNREPGNYSHICLKNGETAVIRFGAIIDFKGHHSKMGPYFNIANHNGEASFVNSKAATAALGRQRVQIQARALSATDFLAEFYPEDTVKTSTGAIGTIALIQSQLDEKNEVDESNITRCTRIVDVPDPSEDEEDQHFDVILTSHLLLPAIKSEKSNFMPKVTLDDIDSGLPLSPSKLRGRTGTKPTPTSATNQDIVRLRDMDDPDGVYAMCDDLLGTEVVAPKITNGKGNLIHPKDYDKLPSSSIAIIKVSICYMHFPIHNVRKSITHLRLQTMRLLNKSLEHATAPLYITPAAKSVSTSTKSKRKLGKDASSSKDKTLKKRRTRATASDTASSTAKGESGDKDDGQTQMSGVED
ncbi:hypothetical protein FA15DRAFT_707865 [Coprinopsis marcescibilis]|uniref:Uncharacterized protein n=1 Tax=Coprinopsis marcescibilis TaxID=230819 RepID=A0A5C3KL34_COPMA|nr:hypothetical protein FA15DRAFT_707865 [Coprinopsis marcescibilis]